MISLNNLCAHTIDVLFSFNQSMISLNKSRYDSINLRSHSIKLDLTHRYMISLNQLKISINQSDLIRSI